MLRVGREQTYRQTQTHTCTHAHAHTIVIFVCRPLHPRVVRFVCSSFERILQPLLHGHPHKKGTAEANKTAETL